MLDFIRLKIENTYKDMHESSMEQNRGYESPHLVVIPYLIWIISTEIVQYCPIWSHEIPIIHLVLRLSPSDYESCQVEQDINHCNDKYE
jgi:hypothetical protein